MASAPQDAAFSWDSHHLLAPLSRAFMVPHALSEAIADVVHLVQYYKHLLRPYEVEARAHGDHAVHDLVERAYEGLAPVYAELRERASHAAEPCMADPHALQEAKSYTALALTPLLMSAPMVARAYKKPLGVAPDYQVLLYCHADALEGETAFDKLFHRLFVRHPLAAGMRTRRDYVSACIGQELARHAPRAATVPFRVTALGCGSAQELAHFVSTQRHWEGQVSVRVIEQGMEMLHVVQEQARRAVSGTTARGRVEGLALSPDPLLKALGLLPESEPQQLIYATGLFDALPTYTAERAVAALYERLAPGGQLVISNAKGPSAALFCPELVLDWSLHYRTRAQMEALARLVPHAAARELVLEESGTYWILKVRKGEG